MFNSDSEEISLKSKFSKIGSHASSIDLGFKDQLEKEREKKKLKLDADHHFFKEYQAMQDAFTRLDANDDAIKDNIKNLLETHLQFQSVASEQPRGYKLGQKEQRAATSEKNGRRVNRAQLANAVYKANHPKSNSPII